MVTVYFVQLTKQKQFYLMDSFQNMREITITYIPFTLSDSVESQKKIA